jgi:hypothetical protein
MSSAAGLVRAAAGGGVSSFDSADQMAAALVVAGRRARLGVKRRTALS